MSIPACTLTFLAARPDMPFIRETLPHLVRMLRFPFSERLLLIDTAPLPPRYDGIPGIGTLEEMLALGRDFIRTGVIDRIIEVRHTDPSQLAIYRSQHTRPVRHTRDHRGYPNLACALELALPQTDYLLHFDSDMLLHCAPGFDWVSHAIQLLEEHPDIIAVAPRPGPPTPDGSLTRQPAGHVLDPAAFYRFKHFSTRRFLIDRRRFRRLLPIEPRSASRRLWLESLFRFRSPLEAWEVLISRALEKSMFFRADTGGGEAWTLHTPDHGAEFLWALPRIITRIERGDFPPAQAGDYDLQLRLWT